MNEQTISKSLHELSKAIEQLAEIITHEKESDNTQAKDLSLLVDSFANSTKQLQLKAKKQNSNNLINKHKKGYLEDWLQEKYIYTGRSIDQLRVDEKLFKVADFLADHYRQLREFYSELKRHQNFKEDFISYTDKSSFNYIKNWLKLLEENSIIESYHVLKRNKIDVDIAEIHKATLFISGNWLEILLRKEVALALYKHADKIYSFDILAQVQLIKPDKTNSELDLLLMINNKVFWFECKTGAIGSYYKRFEQHRKLMGLDDEHSFLVVPEPHKHHNKIALQRSGMSTIYATDIEKQLSQILFHS
jgi:hypothetical protein